MSPDDPKDIFYARNCHKDIGSFLSTLPSAHNNPVGFKKSFFKFDHETEGKSCKPQLLNINLTLYLDAVLNLRKRFFLSIIVTSWVSFIFPSTIQRFSDGPWVMSVKIKENNKLTPSNRVTTATMGG